MNKKKPARSTPGPFPESRVKRILELQVKYAKRQLRDPEKITKRLKKARWEAISKHLRERNATAVSQPSPAVSPESSQRVDAALLDLRAKFSLITQAYSLSPAECGLVAEKLQQIPPDHIIQQGIDALRQPLLPTRAPRLWAERDKDERLNPAQFVREVYGGWFGKGFARGMIGDLDPLLYQSYAKWIQRHPEDEIKELPSQRSDTEALIEKLTKFASLGELRRVGLALQTRRHREKLSI
jgi:hypothetical protein